MNTNTRVGVEWVNAAITATMGDNSAVAHRIMASAATTLERLATDEHKIYAMMQKGGIGKLIETAKNYHTQERGVKTSCRLFCLILFVAFHSQTC